MPGYEWMSLTTDYGLSEGFVAALHGAIGRLAPAVRVIDVTHLITPGDIRGGAEVLAQTVPYLPRAVHVGVVDPGVGTARRPIAIEARDGTLVGPDNGLMVPAAEALGGVVRAVHLTNRAWFEATVSMTFHGRDIFAPVGARLAAGAPLADAGTEIDPADLVRLPEPTVTVGDGYLEAEVVLVDRFGNVQLAAPGSALAGLPETVMVGGLRAVHGSTFGDVAPGDLVVYADSADRVAIAVNAGRAIDALSVRGGDLVRITAA